MGLPTNEIRTPFGTEDSGLLTNEDRTPFGTEDTGLLTNEDRTQSGLADTPEKQYNEYELNYHKNCPGCYVPGTWSFKGKENHCAQCGLEWCQICFRNNKPEYVRVNFPDMQDYRIALSTSFNKHGYCEEEMVWC